MNGSKTSSLIVGLVLLSATGCGAGSGSESSGSSSSSSTQPPVADSAAPSMATCVKRWNSELPNDGLVQARPGMRAMVFTYSGSECGVALDTEGSGGSQNDASLAVYINRGPRKPKANFTSMMIPTNDGGGVQRIIDGAFKLASMAPDEANATLDGGLRLTADSGTDIVRTDVTGAPNGNYVTQPETMKRRYNYAVNKPDWDALSKRDQREAIAQFLADNAEVCQVKTREGLAKAYREGQLYPTEDGMQTTLWVGCVYFETGVNPWG